MAATATIEIFLCRKFVLWGRPFYPWEVGGRRLRGPFCASVGTTQESIVFRRTRRGRRRLRRRGLMSLSIVMVY